MKYIIENQILSPINVYSLFIKSESIIIEKFDNYNKRTFRNRFIILSSNGPQLISIPLKKGKNNNNLFNGVKISYDTNWISNLNNTFKTCYGSSPYFDFFSTEIMDIFEKQHELLYVLNKELREYFFKILEIETHIVYSESYKTNYQNSVTDLRGKYSPATNHLSINSPKIKYPQVFEDKLGFIPNVSIIDLVFNMGKQASIMLDV